jgi:hypothetical protein
MKIIYTNKEAEKELSIIKECEVEIQVEPPDKKWIEKDGIIYLSVVSNGLTGKEWINRLKDGGNNVSSYAEDLLNSKNFKLTKNIKYELAIIRGDKEYTTLQEIRDKAKQLKLKTPNAEIACLIREKLDDKDIKDMGLWGIIAAHEPIKDSGGGPFLLYSGRRGGGLWLYACYDEPDRKWYRGDGFAFAVSQVELKS